jgi:diacylglycerol kinase family enzyme
MNIEIIANPNSGSGRGTERAQRIAELCSTRGHNVGVHFSRSRQDVCDWGERVAQIADRLVVVGGDGTINAALNGMSSPPPPIAISPLGTANVLAHVLKISKRPEDTVTLIERGVSQLIDVPLVSFQQHENPATQRSFLCIGFGLDGEIMRIMDEHRSGPIHMAEYLKPLGLALKNWRPHLQTVVADGEVIGDFAYGVISGVNIYGSPLLRLGNCDLDDQRWELFLFKDINLLSGGLFALAAASGQLRKHPHVTHLSAEHVQINGAEPAPLQIDGDFVGYSAVELKFDNLQVPILTTS